MRNEVTKGLRPGDWKKNALSQMDSAREVTETRNRALETLEHSARLSHLADQLRHLKGDNAAERIATEGIDFFDAAKRKARFRDPDLAVRRGDG